MTRNEKEERASERSESSGVDTRNLFINHSIRTSCESEGNFIVTKSCPAGKKKCVGNRPLVKG